MSINKSLIVDNSQKEKIPQFSKSRSFQIVLDWLCKLPDEREPKTITALARDAGVSREMVYRYMRHDFTKERVLEYVRSLALQDQTKVYQNITEMTKSNPRAARLWHELYHDWKGPGDRSGGNIIINLGIFGENKTDSKKCDEIQNVAIDYD